MTLEKDLFYEKNMQKTHFLEKMKKNQRVTAKALHFDSKNGLIMCSLSDYVTAILPISEVVMTELKALPSKQSDNIIYPEITNMIGKKIAVKLTYYDEKKSSFYVSRRDSLLEAFEELKSEFYIYCEIKAMTTKTIIVDCGYGVPGAINIKDSTTCMIRKVSDSFKIGDVIKCAVLSVNEEAKNISLSRKLAVEASDIVLHEHDIVYGRVREEFNDDNDSLGQKSYIFEILPYNFCGILNTFFDSYDLEYNDLLVCFITKVNYGNRYKLKVIKHLY